MAAEAPVQEAVSLPGAARQLHLVFESPAEFRREYERNLTKGGAFIATREGFELLEPVEVLLEAPFAGETLRLRAEIVHCQPLAGVSVQLLDATPLLRARLDAILEKAEALDLGAEQDVVAPGDAGAFEVGELGDLALDPAPDEFDDWCEAGSGERPSALADPRDDDPNERTYQVRADRSCTRVIVLIRRPGAEWRTARSRDLSASGLLLSIEGEDLPVGCNVALSIAHPAAGLPLQVAGTIVRHLEGHGVVPAVAVRMRPGERQAEVESFVEELRRLHEERQRAGTHERFTEGGVEAALRAVTTHAPRGTLTVASGIEEGTILFEANQMLAASLGPARGLKALARILAWQEGFLEFHSELDPLSQRDAPMAMEAAIRAARRTNECPVRGRAESLEPATRFTAVGGVPGAVAGLLEGLEADVFELAANGVTLRRILDRIPSSDAEIVAALITLLESGLLAVV
jgi:hypothetical protein